jgi:uncharacterized membrane protein YgcG
MSWLRLPWRRRVDEPEQAWEPAPVDDETVALLERYAAGPLSPGADELNRGRTAAVAAYAASDVMAALRQARPRPRRAVRYVAAAAAMAVLMLSGAGIAAAESGPGQPFYRTRLAIEAWFLPPAGSEARLDADLDRAQARLEEAVRAAAVSDWNAEADALGAYTDVVASMSVPQDTASQERVRNRLGQELGTLQDLAAGPGSAAGQASRAVQSVNDLLAGSGGGSMPGPGTTPAGRNATPGPTSEPSPSGGGPMHSPGPNASQDSGGGQGPGGGSGGNPSSSPSMGGPGGSGGGPGGSHGGEGGPGAS